MLTPLTYASTIPYFYYPCKPFLKNFLLYGNIFLLFDSYMLQYITIGGKNIMYINEYGNKAAPVIILLAPMMVSGQNMYELMNPHLKGEYRIIAPDQGGHGKAGAYVSVEQEYNELKDWLLKNGIKKIRLVLGASLGAALAYKLYLDTDFAVEKAWLDGVALKRSAGFAEWFMCRMFKKRKRKLSKNSDAAPSKSLVKMYGSDFATMMRDNFKQITESDIEAICHACCHYELKSFTAEQQKNLHLEYGETDPDYMLSKKAIAKYLPDVEPTIRKGYSHCGYMAAHTKEYVEEIESFIANAAARR